MTLWKIPDNQGYHKTLKWQWFMGVMWAQGRPTVNHTYFLKGQLTKYNFTGPNMHVNRLALLKTKDTWDLLILIFYPLPSASGYRDNLLLELSNNNMLLLPYRSGLMKWDESFVFLSHSNTSKLWHNKLPYKNINELVIFIILFFALNARGDI